MLDKACGVDVHRNRLVADIDSDTTMEEARFENSLEGIENMKTWLKRKPMQTCGYGVHRGLPGPPLHSPLRRRGSTWFWRTPTMLGAYRAG